MVIIMKSTKTNKVAGGIKKKQKFKSSKSLSNNLKINLDKEITIENTKSSTENGEETEKIEASTPSTVDLNEKYPVFKNEELVKKFLEVTMTNNQKGRIRQQLKDQLKDTANTLLPDVIHNKILAIIKNSNTLTDAELRKVRILYNMLKTTVQVEKAPQKTDKKKKNKKTKKEKKLKETENPNVLEPTPPTQETIERKKDKPEGTKTEKMKGPKRYVVFVGNLPVDITKDIIIKHFWDLNESIVSVRIPKREEGNKSCIAYVELKNEPSYELALSKHHSMMGGKRINVLYTTQKKSKISKTEAKSKSAKLIALQKSGKLAGSLPMNKKRSHRRMIAKQAQTKLDAESK